MIIAPAPRGRGAGASGRRAAAVWPAVPLFRLDGGLPCAAAAGVASPAPAVREAPAAALVAPEARPIVVSPVASAERPILERFLADLAAAPELAGELVALYVEQHPQLTVRFVAAAMQADDDAGPAIVRAARRREAAGLRGLSLVLLAAMALVAPAELALDSPPVILDIDGAWFEGDCPW